MITDHCSIQFLLFIAHCSLVIVMLLAIQVNLLLGTIAAMLRVVSVPGMIAGAILGTLLGAAAGMLFVEYRARRDWGLAWKAAAAYIIGYILSSLVQLAICLVMIAIFVWQALL